MNGRIYFFLIALLLGAFSTAYAQTCPGSAGCLDPSFGSAGTTIMAAPHGPIPTNILQQSDGKIVTMGRGYTTYGHKVTRINSDGTPDATFANGGIASFIWPQNANDIAIQMVGGEERFLVAGVTSITVGRKTVSGRLRIDRLLPNGTLDPTWGQNGVLTMNANSAFAIAVQPDQKILLTSATYGTLMRLNPNGSIDTSFGSSGLVNSGDSREVLLDASGRIYVAGIYSTGKGNNVKRFYALKRYSSSGIQDMTFGTNGVSLSRQLTSIYFSMHIDVAGNILIGTTNGTDYTVERFDSGGDVDTSFSGDGYVTLDFNGGDEGALVGVTTDGAGRVIIAGTVEPSPTTSEDDVGVFRLNYDGSIDSSFGDGGKVSYDVAGFYDFVGSVILQTDPACACDKIVVAGGTTGGSPNEYTFIRVLTENQPPTP